MVSTVDDIGVVPTCSSDDILSVTAVESSADDAILTEVETTISDEDSATDLPSTADIYDDRVCSANEITSMMQSSSSDSTYGSSDAGVITPALAMSTILIKTRKPRRKGDKPLVKMMLSDPNQTHINQREGVIEYPEPTAEGLKKKNALESLKQAQSLFKFIPRGSTIAESSSSMKVCRGVKGHRHITEAISSDALHGEVNVEAVSSLSSDSSGSVRKLSPVILSSDTTLPVSFRGVDEVQEKETHHVQCEENNTSSVLIEKEVKQKIKPKLKEERKKYTTKVETLYQDRTAGHQVIQSVIIGENSTVSVGNVNSAVRAVASSSSKALEGTEEIQEKIHTKRKYTFQQPLVKRTSVLRQNARLVVDASDSDCGFGGTDKIPPPNSLTLVRSDSMETDSNSNMATDESAAPIEDEEESPRASIAHDDMDMGDGTTAPKTIRYEKKENVKRPGRGESKECSMTEVPGRHLLGPKMLAFMRAFPEGDVIGNDDVETSRTQRIRMESWLQALKGDSGSQINIAKDAADDADDDDMAELKDETEKIKMDLLKGIEEKLTKAGGATGRGSGGSSVLLKPGMVQILLPYEVNDHLCCILNLVFDIDIVSLFTLCIFCLVLLCDFILISFSASPRLRF